MLSVTHKIALLGVMLVARGFAMTQPVSADTLNVHNEDKINVDFDRKTVKIGRMTYPYELSNKEVATLQHFKGSGTSLTITTDKHHVARSVKKYQPIKSASHHDLKEQTVWLFISLTIIIVTIFTAIFSVL